MTARRKELLRFLLSETEGLGRVAAFEQLFELGAVDACACGRAAIRAEVERLVRRGTGRCEAMEAAAIRFGCSYSKVRNIIYYKPKN